MASALPLQSDGGGSVANEPVDLDHRRLDEVFGDVLPDVTRDERDERRPSNDDALLDDRPPHHDRG